MRATLALNLISILKFFDQIKKKKILAKLDLLIFRYWISQRHGKLLVKIEKLKKNIENTPNPLVWWNVVPNSSFEYANVVLFSTKDQHLYVYHMKLGIAFDQPSVSPKEASLVLLSFPIP